MSEEEQQLPELLSVQAQAMVDGAKRLGLTWTLRPATVTANADGPSVVYDGDTILVGAVPLNGSAIPGDRVMMLQIPPGGNYIIGRLPGSPLTPLMTASFRGSIASAGDVVITTVAQTITPLVSLALTSPGEYMITASVDIDYTVSGGNNLVAVALQVDGVGQTDQIIFQITANATRIVLSKSWYGTLATGTHTFQLIVAKSLATGTWTTRAVGTGFIYQIWQ